MSSPKSRFTFFEKHSAQLTFLILAHSVLNVNVKIETSDDDSINFLGKFVECCFFVTAAATAAVIMTTATIVRISVHVVVIAVVCCRTPEPTCNARLEMVLVCLYLVVPHSFGVSGIAMTSSSVHYLLSPLAQQHPPVNFTHVSLSVCPTPVTTNSIVSMCRCPRSGSLIN